MANEYRGEVTLKLVDTELTLRPSYEAIAEIENRLGRIPALIDRFTQGDVGVVDLAVLIWAGVNAHNGDDGDDVMTIEKVGGMIVQHGFLELIRTEKQREPLSQFLINMITGGKAPKKKPPESRGEKPAKVTAIGK